MPEKTEDVTCDECKYLTTKTLPLIGQIVDVCSKMNIEDPSKGQLDLSEPFPDWCPGGELIIVKKPDVDTDAERPIGEIVNEYVELRDYLKAERKKFKELETNIKLDMELLEAKILDKQRQLGLTSLSTPSHTAFQTTKEYFRVGDWDTVIAFIKKTGNYQMLEKRIGKLATKEIVETPGEDGKLIVPSDIGVDYSSEVHVQIRKK